ncbi:MAG TPA: PRC-barrel domain-containing protein [Ilumatobacter sp.]|nr:PRC-barrel domain-containing protein [Ilumatobacter sp.]
MSEHTDLWTYRSDVWSEGRDVVGYDVEAQDGDIGKIDASTAEAGTQHVVVDTGFWIFGKKRLIPAAAVSRIDHEAERVYVDLSKDQIKDAPDFDEMRAAESDRLRQHEDYYGRMGW